MRFGGFNPSIDLLTNPFPYPPPHRPSATATVQRVVLTSSFRSVFGLGDEYPPGHIYTEADWNTKSSLENNQGYALSKILAERAAWVYGERPNKTWDLVVLNPGTF